MIMPLIMSVFIFSFLSDFSPCSILSPLSYYIFIIEYSIFYIISRGLNFIFFEIKNAAIGKMNILAQKDVPVHHCVNFGVISKYLKTIMYAVPIRKQDKYTGHLIRFLPMAK